MTSEHKRKQTYRYREQTIGYQWGEGKGKGQDGVGNFLKSYYGIIGSHVSETFEIAKHCRI